MSNFKCLNEYAVFGENAKKGALIHLPVFQDEAGVKFIHLNGQFKPFAENNKNFIRFEPAALGN